MALMGAGAVGAAAAVGIVAATGNLGRSTTVREEVGAARAASASETASFARGLRPLTIHEVYTRAAPGVVQVTATSRVSVVPNPFLDPFGFGGSTRQTQQALG